MPFVYSRQINRTCTDIYSNYIIYYTMHMSMGDYPDKVLRARLAIFFFLATTENHKSAEIHNKTL